MKRFNCFIAFILVVFTCNVYSMKRLREEKTWAERVAEILLDEANVQDLVGFSHMPPEILERIIYLLSANVAAESLEDAAKSINNLALVNKQLNELINDPSFCLRLIKHFSKKFNCSNQVVTRALQTQEAQRRLELQKKFYDACRVFTPNIQYLEQLLSEGADVNFVYNSGALLEEVYNNHFDSDNDDYVDIIRWLVNNGTNQNQKNLFLGYVIEGLYEGIKLRRELPDIIKILLDANADPEAMNRKGDSMLKVMQQVLDDQQEEYDEIMREDNIEILKTIMQLLEDAIKRKQKRDQKE